MLSKLHKPYTDSDSKSKYRSQYMFMIAEPHSCEAISIHNVGGCTIIFIYLLIRYLNDCKKSRNVYLYLFSHLFSHFSLCLLHSNHLKNPSYSYSAKWRSKSYQNTYLPPPTPTSPFHSEPFPSWGVREEEGPKGPLLVSDTWKISVFLFFWS